MMQKHNFVAKRKLGRSHENPGSPVDDRKANRKEAMRSSHTDQQIDQTLEKLRLSMQTDRIGKKAVYTSDLKRSRQFGSELDQNSLPKAKIDNFTKTSAKQGEINFRS